jgi:hypothetical protein
MPWYCQMNDFLRHHHHCLFLLLDNSLSVARQKKSETTFKSSGYLCNFSNTSEIRQCMLVFFYYVSAYSESASYILRFSIIKMLEEIYAHINSYIHIHIHNTHAYPPPAIGLPLSSFQFITLGSLIVIDFLTLSDFPCEEK